MFGEALGNDAKIANVKFRSDILKNIYIYKLYIFKTRF